MAMTHPHANAAYRTVPLSGGAFGVEITIPGSHPTTMSSFGTEAKAGEWIARHKSFVKLNAPFSPSLFRATIRNRQASRR
jgi:hypothetical protein